MSDNLSIQGSLGDTTVPDLFRSLIRSKETSVVSLACEGRHDSVYFRDGRMMFATSSDPDLSLAAVLLAKGELSIAQYQEVMDSSGSHRSVDAALRELGYLRTEDLHRATEAQVSRIVHDAILFRSGEYSVEFLSEIPEEIQQLTIDTELLMLGAITNIEHWSLIERGIGSLARIVRAAPGADARAYQIELSEQASHVFTLFAEPMAVAQACERSYFPNFIVCRTIWALMSIGLLENADAVEADEHRSYAAVEYELEGIVETYNTAFEAFFKLVFDEIGDYTFDFVDRVMARMSPRLLPALNGMSLINESRIDVDQLLENLATQSAGERKRMVRDVLDELLCCWIREIDREFSARFQSNVSTIVGGLKR